MTTAQQQFNDVFAEGQQVLTQGVRAWQDAVSTATSTMVQNMQKFGGVPNVPTPQVDTAQVDTMFNVADQLLTIQRQYAKTVLESGLPVAEAASKSAQQATEAWQNAVQDSAKVVQHAATSAAQAAEPKTKK